MSTLPPTDSQLFFQALADQTRSPMGVSDDDGNYTWVNQAFCELVGYSEQELLCMTVFDVTSDSQDRATFAKTKGEGEGARVLVVLKRKDGTDFLAEVIGKNITYGDHARVLGVVFDVSERERLAEENIALERELLHARKLESLSILAGGVAHDFNNLLAVILGNANLALDDVASTSQARASLHEIEAATLRAAELTKQMVAYSGKGHFLVEPVEIRKLLDSMATLLQSTVSKKINLEFDLGADVPAFMADAGQIRQVIMNLFTNAAEAVGDNVGTIKVSTSALNYHQGQLPDINSTLRANLMEPLRDGRHVVIKVSDTGCGMTAETIERVFDPFFTTKFTGRGLSMSAVLGIIRGHKGAINVESVVGAGTTLTLVFPASDEHKQAAVGPATSDIELDDWRGHGTVLLVDDEPSVRKLGERMLTLLGFDVLIARDGPEALTIYDENAADITLVLLDFTMPKMDGHQVFGELRRRDSALKVVLSSGYAESDATRDFDGMLAGFVQKPYGLATLKRTLADVLG